MVIHMCGNNFIAPAFTLREPVILSEAKGRYSGDWRRFLRRAKGEYK
jgi:hypothetical protein